MADTEFKFLGDFRGRTMLEKVTILLVIGPQQLVKLNERLSTAGILLMALLV